VEHILKQSLGQLHLPLSYAMQIGLILEKQGAILAGLQNEANASLFFFISFIKSNRYNLLVNHSKEKAKSEKTTI
jgi:hypothetical protein